MLEFLFNKVLDLKTHSFIKKTPTQVFSCEIFENFENAYFEEHLRTTCELLRKISQLLALVKSGVRR